VLILLAKPSSLLVGVGYLTDAFARERAGLAAVARDLRVALAGAGAKPALASSIGAEGPGRGRRPLGDADRAKAPTAVPAALARSGRGRIAKLKCESATRARHGPTSLPRARAAKRNSVQNRATAPRDRHASARHPGGWGSRNRTAMLRAATELRHDWQDVA
jgi:hypothetical protein